MIIDGYTPMNVIEVLSGQAIGTKIEIQNIRYLHLKEYRMKYASDPIGRIYVNTGAAKAILERKASLLSVGILRVEESFPEQSVVAVYDESDQNIAKGVVRYSSNTIDKMKGMKSAELDFFFDGGGEVINRDYMVFLD